jgi:hypothetical protein
MKKETRQEGKKEKWNEINVVEGRVNLLVVMKLGK